MTTRVIRTKQLLPDGHVRAGHLPDASSFGHVSFVVEYFPDNSIKYCYC